MKRFVTRHQSRLSCACWFKAGLGAILGMGLVGWLGDISNVPFLIAPFGASCVLLFAVPRSPLSQPVNVVGGHVLATAVALALRAVLPPDWWAISLAVGIVIAVMVATRLTHPPAGADPVVVFLADPGWMFLLAPILLGSLALVAIAALVHRLPPRTEFPMLREANRLDEAKAGP